MAYFSGGRYNLAPIVPPPEPNIVVCDKVYGENLIINDCLFAADELPTGEAVRTYSLRGPPDDDYSLPWQKSHGQCWITIEANGPSALSGQALAIKPNDLRTVTAWVMQQCGAGRNGRGSRLGGFATWNFAGLVSYIRNPFIDPSGLYPTSTTFITVSVTGPTSRKFSPGNTDSYIPLSFSSELSGKGSRFPPNSEMRMIYNAASMDWVARAIATERGGTGTWWQAITAPDEMDYVCDANLGDPAVADCTQIEWNQLTPVADTVEVGPENPTFLHFNTCYLALSSSSSITISWSAIRTAVSSLTSICIYNPMFSPSDIHGGRAYHVPPHSINSRPSAKTQRDTPPSGLNAFPPGFNLTIFRQDEPWVDTATEMRSCTWQAVLKGEKVGLCAGK